MYVLKPRKFEREITREILVTSHNDEWFLRMITGGEKWLHYDNPKEIGHCQFQRPSLILIQNSCYVFSTISLVSSVMNCSNSTKPLLWLDKIWDDHSKKTLPILFHTHSVRKSLQTHCIDQTLPLPMITCSNPWYMDCLRSTSHHTKTPKMLLISG